MTTSQVLGYVTQLIAINHYKARVPRFPTLMSLVEFIREKEPEVDVEEVRGLLNQLREEGKVKSHRTINDILIEL